MKQLILYGTSGCHLCEQAAELLAYVLDEEIYDVKEIDISESDVLLAIYGEKIPVLRRPDRNEEINWPFDEDAIWRFLLAE